MMCKGFGPYWWNNQYAFQFCFNAMRWYYSIDVIQEEPNYGYRKVHHVRIFGPLQILWYDIEWIDT